MTVQVNQSVVSGFVQPQLPDYLTGSIPVFAQPACLSNVQQAPWTNRVPAHEPWPRTLMGDTVGANDANDECERNTSHNPQFVDDGGGIGSQSIGRVEGTITIQRGEFWRR
jgi:hypothetical protein